MSAAAVADVEHHDNVIHVDFHPADAGWLAAGDTLPAIRPRPLPARWSPRPVRVLRRRFARSELAADLRDYGWLMGLLFAGLLCVSQFDLTFQDLARLLDLTAGGTP